jgi:flagellar hook-associated protein 1
MSISGALSSSLSGLTAAARAAEVVSSNIANARTEGYGRREVQLSARSVGGTGQGVQVDGVRRMVDLVLLTDRRIAQSGSADRDLQARFFAAMESAIGTPETEGALGQRISTLEQSLIAAAARRQALDFGVQAGDICKGCVDVLDGGGDIAVGLGARILHSGGRSADLLRHRYQRVPDR